jgi:single-strand DNA-binding protein
MASNDATLTIIGNLTKDPEVRFANSGTAMASFSVAVNKSRKDKTTGEWVKETSYFDCVAWGENAENFANSFSKGNRVIVTGQLQQRKYEGQDGTEKTKLELIVDEIGATVKYATLVITKTQRPDGENAGGSGNGGNNFRSNQFTGNGGRVSEQNSFDDFGGDPF